MQEETIYGDLQDLEKKILNSFIQTSLREMSMVGPSGSNASYVIQGIDAPTNRSIM